MKPNWRIKSCVALCLALGFFCAELCAQEKATPIRNPSEPNTHPSDDIQAILPDPAAPGFVTRFISKANADLYRQQLIPELHKWLRDGVLEIEAAAKLAYDWRYDQELADKLAALGDDRLARINAIGEWHKSIKLNFNLISANHSKGDTLSLGGEYFRIYPHALDAQDKTIQVFRELMRFSRPELLSPFKVLTFRFGGKEEDKLWVHSPAIGLTRELTGSNRTDLLLKTSFSLDDMFVWSGKAENVEVRFDKILTALVPFAGLKTADLKQLGDGCEQVYGGSFAALAEESQTLWNFGTSKYPSAASWLPTQAVFVPRELERLELTSLDPFALYGRQVLYIDKQTSLPVYKIVYDRAGRHWKTIIGAYGMATNRDKTRNLPFNFFLIAVDVLRESAHVFEYPEITFCSRYSKALDLAQFDPRALGPAAAPTAPAKG